MVTLDTLSLASEFPAASREQWLKLVEETLKGAPYDKKLVSRTYDGLRIEPIYPRAPGAAPIAGRAPTLPWQVMQRVDHPDPTAANTEALHDLENGANGLSLIFAGSNGAYGYGLDASEAAIARALENVHLDAGIALDLDLGPAADNVGKIIAGLVRQRGYAPESTAIRFGFDPIGGMAAGWRNPSAWGEAGPRLATEIKALAEAGFAGPHAAADGRIIHAAGGSEAQELAYTLAAAVSYLRALEAAGMALDAARRMLFFRLAADADQFLTIAKFRALRKLWARVEEASGLAPEPIFIAAETAWRMMTKRDPWVNMLRATIAVFSAGLGGANAITVLPFTAALGLPDRFARRIARNTQLVLLEESNLAKVTDPAAGSGGFEDLTDQLCRAAWSLFQEIERAGGAPAALEQGLIQQKVATVRAERERNVALRKEPLTGTSEFAHLQETPVSVLDVPPVAAAGARERSPSQVLAPHRLAEPYEALRDASDRILEKTGARPKVFLANLGPISAFTARAMFAKSFFEAGGIEAVALEPSPLGGEGRREAPGCGDTASTPQPLPPARSARGGRGEESTLAAAFVSSGASLACLCSSDDVYAREAAEAARTLAAAGATHIYLAGRPGNAEAALREAGVQTFVYAGCDVLGALKAAHVMLDGGQKTDRR